MTVPQINITHDYSIFKTVNFNRDKSSRHIESLKRIISKENLLHLHPILVNENMEVIDGQHRLEAAKELGLSIYYIQGKLSYEHILNSNLFQKKLGLDDVIKFYAVKDRLEPYIQVRDYLKMLNVTPKALLGLIFGGTTKPLIEFMKSGKFQMPPNAAEMERLIELYKRLRDFAEAKRITPLSMLTGSPFTIGYRNLCLMSAFNETVFFNKLDQRWFELKPQLNPKEWTRQLVSIYNWKNHNPLENYDA